MIGRIADVIFLETDLEFEKLHIKIENVLDTVLKMVGCQRREVKLKIESESESDNDY